MEGESQRLEENSSVFSPNLLKEFYSVPELLDEFTKPCGRFKSPLSTFDKLEISIAKFASASRIFRNIASIPNYAMPPNWQILLNYFYRQGILTEPRFIIQPQRNDFPHFAKAGLLLWEKNENDGAKIRNNGRGFGTAIAMDEAYSKAVGEFLERYLLTLYDKRTFVRAPYDTLRTKHTQALNIDLLPQFLPWQKEKFPELKSARDTELYWAMAKELVSGARAYVPAQLIFWGNNFHKELGEPYLRQPTTNGQAGGFTFEESALSALYENVERDSFLIFWFNTISPPVLDISAVVDTDIQKVLYAIQQYGLRAYVLDTTTDLSIPSCVCVIVDKRGSEPVVTMGGSAGYSLKKNLLSCLTEALSVASSFTPGTVPPDDYTPFVQKNIDRDERINMWHGEKMLKRFNFFISGARVPIYKSRFGKYTKEFASTALEYEYTLASFKNMGAGYELYCYEVQHPVLKKIGYHVTKVIVPQLMQLYLNEHMATLGCKRLREVPAKLGYTKTKLNPWPHPFP